jgi:hypothetical protein
VNVDAGVVSTACRSSDGAYLGASTVAYEGITHPGYLDVMGMQVSTSSGGRFVRWQGLGGIRLYGGDTESAWEGHWLVQPNLM